MSKEISKLIEIAQELQLEDNVLQLSEIQKRMQQPDTELIIPFVGEFSSGKTSIINALTDSKGLEVASKATTATIFEVRFSGAEQYAVVYPENGDCYQVDDIKSLKNDDLLDVKIVQVFDTSEKIPASVVLTDTPGLSSLEPRHQKALTNYLPLADVILVAVDINQGVTASVLKFINTTANLVKKRLYIVITKTDTKSKAEIEEVKRYIKDNTKIDIEKIICVSAYNNEVSELTGLIAEIQKNKNQIVGEVTVLRIEQIQKEILAYIDEMLTSSKLSTPELDKKIAEESQKLQAAKTKINALIAGLERKIEDISDNTVHDFNNRIYNELEAIALNPPKGYNINEITRAQIDSVANLLFGNFKTDIKTEIGRLSRGQNLTEGVPIPVLDALNLSDISLNLSNSYNIDMELPELQAMNRKIANGIKVAAAVAAVIVTAGVAAPAVGKTAVAEGAVAASRATATEAVIATDVVTDVATVVTMKHAFKKGIKEIGKKGITEMGSNFDNSMNTLNLYEQQASQYIPVSNKQTGLAGLVGMITEHTHAKPQRKRLIDNFISSELQPRFKQQMIIISNSIISTLHDTLNSETESKIKQMQDGLEQLKSEKDTEKGLFKQRIEKIENFKKELEG